jgi:hypothetical protein
LAFMKGRTRDNVTYCLICIQAKYSFAIIEARKSVEKTKHAVETSEHLQEGKFA